MTLLKNTAICLQCGKPMKGRADKKFCDDYCRNAYNNLLRSSTNKQVKVINNILIKNRRILESMIAAGEHTAKTTKATLLKQGFRFTHHTHMYTTRSGSTYTYCYDYGYLPLENDWYLVVRLKQE